MFISINFNEFYKGCIVFYFLLPSLILVSRLQEIAGSFEHQILSPFAYTVETPGDTSETPGDTSETQEDANTTEARYYLPVTDMLVLCLKRCWDEDVMLKPLTHRFYKLSLQVGLFNVALL